MKPYTDNSCNASLWDLGSSFCSDSESSDISCQLIGFDTVGLWIWTSMRGSSDLELELPEELTVPILICTRVLPGFVQNLQTSPLRTMSVYFIFVFIPAYFVLILLWIEGIRLYYLIQLLLYWILPFIMLPIPSTIWYPFVPLSSLRWLCML